MSELVSGPDLVGLLHDLVSISALEKKVLLSFRDSKKFIGSIPEAERDTCLCI